MAFNPQGRVNFAGLDNYTIKGAGLDLGEQFWESAVKELIGSRQAVGIIYGGAISLVAALQVKVTKGLALFDNGIMVSWDDQLVTLTAADVANPRLDRLQLTYSLVNDIADLDNNNNPVTLDKLHVATAAALAGVPGGVPVAPARTLHTLSLGVIHVAAGQVALGGGDIDQTEDSSRDLSYTLLASSPFGIRFNTRLGYIQITADGATWRALLPGGSTKVIVFADSPYTVTPDAPNIEVNTAGGPVQVNLPALASAFPVEVTKISADANVVTIVPHGAETINDDANDSLAVKYSSNSYKPLSIGWRI